MPISLAAGFVALLSACSGLPNTLPLEETSIGLATVKGGAYTKREKAVLIQAACLVGTKPALVKEALAIPPGVEFGNTIVALVAGNCQNRAVSFPRDLMRYPLAIALYRVRFHKTAPQIQSQAIVPSQIGAESDYSTITREVADCIVHRNPSAVHSALIADLDEEHATYETLQPTISYCASENASFWYDDMMIGGLLAESLLADESASIAKQLPSDAS